MSMRCTLPALPRLLRLFPNQTSLQQVQMRSSVTRTTDADMTFAKLWQVLGRDVARQRIDHLAGRLLVRELLQTLGGLSLLQPNNSQIVWDYHAAIMELRSSGVSAQPLQAAPLSPRTASLVRLLASYEQTLDALQLADEADAQRQAILDVACGRIPSALADLTDIVVEAGNEIIGAPLDILNAFASRQVNVQVCIPWDANRPAAFAWSEAMLHALESRGHAALQLELDNRIGTGPLANLRACYNTPQVAPTPIQVLSVFSGAAHTRQVVLQTCRWLASNHPMQEIAVVAPTAALRQALCAAYASAGIRATNLESAMLWQTLATQMLLGLLQSNMQQTLFGARIQDPWRLPTKQKLPTHATLLTYCDLACDLLKSLHQRVLPHDLINESKHFAYAIEQAQEQAAQSYVQLQQLLLSIRRFAMLPTPRQQETWRQEEFVQWLSKLCQQTPCSGSSITAGALKVLSPEDMVGTHYDCVLFAGLNAQVFPRPGLISSVLTDAMRAEINRLLGPRLWQCREASGRPAVGLQDHDRWLWLEILASAQKNLVVTVETSADLPEHSQSECVDELLRAAGQEPHTFVAADIRDAPWPVAWQPLAYASQRRGDAESLPLIPEYTYLQTRWQREKQRQNFEYAALDASICAEIVHTVHNKVHSTSKLDTLGLCAFRYFASALLGLLPIPRKQLGSSAREQGSAAHAALHVVYADIVKQGGLAVARSNMPQTFKHAEALVAQHKDLILAEVQVHPWLRDAALEQAWIAVKTQLQRDLSDDSAAEPLALEYGFDDRHHDAAAVLQVWHPQEHRCLHVRGKIDRIEQQGGAFWVVDYKRSFQQRSADRHFQLAIYSAVVWRDMAQKATQIGAAWQSLQDGRRRIAQELCGAPVEILQTWTNNLWARLDPILQGNITPDPDYPHVCVHCDFRNLCRVNQRTLAHVGDVVDAA